MIAAPNDGAYGSGRRVIDEMKAASCRDSIQAMVDTARVLDEWDPLRWDIEARLGREVIRLSEIQSRLTATTNGGTV